jgi:GT2 family glycosyltransferase
MNTNPAQMMVSVIIVSWNARDYLRQCLASLSSEACRYPMEIIVVDNASSDGSVECVKKQYPHVHLIQNMANLGFARANNFGVSASTGRYLCFVNSDVKVLKDCISRLVDYCEGHPEVGMAGPRVIGGDGNCSVPAGDFPVFGTCFAGRWRSTLCFPKTRCLRAIRSRIGRMTLCVRWMF